MPTNPGFHPNFEMDQYPAAIVGAIRALAKNFYVTRSFRPFEIHNSCYYAILGRPTDETSVYLNANREIAIVFSPYGAFEVRTLDAFDEVYDLVDNNRVDKSIRILVSGDAKIEGIIKHYLDQTPEYPIIIPIELRTLRFSQDDSLLAAVQRNYLVRDLFGYQNPLHEEHFFFGRQTVVNTVLDLAKSGQSSSLFGLRKSGKTSTIYAIKRKAKGVGCNVAVVDCSNPAVHARGYSGLLGYVLGEVRAVLGLSGSLPSLGADPPEVSENFFHYLKSALGAAKANVLLVFDEIEHISPGTSTSRHWRDGDDPLFFWQILRSFCQFESKGRFSICLVGTSPRLLEQARINGVDNPVYLFAQKRFIPNFTFDETREMVEGLGVFMGLEFPPSIISSLQDDFGGHPFFTRQVCSKVHQLAPLSRPVRVTDSLLERANVEFSSQLQSYLGEIIERLREAYPEEFDILKAVVDGSRDELNEFGRDAPDLIDHLIGYGLVERANGEFDIRFEAVRRALQRLLPKPAITDDQRWAAISARRNALETNLRTALYHWSRSVAVDQWHRILQSSLTHKRFAALVSREPSVLFSRKESPLYLSDLLMLIKNPAVLPYIAAHRKDIISNLDVVNRVRADAHAMEVSDEEFSAVDAALTCLEMEFSPP